MGTKIGPDCPGSVLAGGSDFTRSQRSSSETRQARHLAPDDGTPGSSVYSPSSNTNRVIHGRGYPGASWLPPEGAGSGPPGLAASSLRSHGSARRLSTTCARLSENGPWPLRGG